MSKFTFLVNRSSKTFAGALKEVEGTPFKEGDKKLDFTYFIKNYPHSPKVLPENIPVKHKLLDRRLTAALDNKKSLASRLKEHSLCDPMVYFSPQDIPFKQPGKMWYVKRPTGTEGKQIFVSTEEDLYAVFQKGFVIQEAVTDVLLAAGRKFTIRVYVLVFNGGIFLFPNGLLIVHGIPYDSLSTDHDVQINHAPDQAHRVVLSDAPFYSYLMMRLTTLVPPVFRVFPELRDAPVTDYCLFGADYLLTADWEPKLLELNGLPNLVHTRQINEAMTSPMLLSLVQTVRNGEQAPGRDRFVKVGEL